jgi:TolB-like protein/DNA-binding winged helix-turn-helix (wHTH) protein/Tfp pilus assembly protein PilF
MPAPTPTSEVLQFGVFELDLRQAELRKQGVKIKLQEQPLRVLQLLLEHRGKIVTREQLRTHIWPANTFVEFDHGLYSAMARLREALGDSAETPRYIETVARRGYRFVVPVSASGNTTATKVRPPARQASLSWRAAWSVLAGLLGGTLLLGIVLGLNIANSRQWLRRSSNPTIRSIAVLPLENLSGDPKQDFFADGMTDELITELAQVGDVRIISRTSAMQYKGVRKPLPKIGAELNVDAVLEGSIVRSSQRVRITAQLIDTKTDQHLWAQSYEHDLDDVLILQGEMAHAIAEEIRARIAPGLGTQAAKRHRIDPAEQELYLQARYHLDKGDEAEIHKGIEFFQQALERDPRDARSYAGLADSYLALTDFYESPTGTLTLAKQAAIKAVQLDDSLAESHEALGTVRFLYDWDWREADKELSRSIELNPSSADAHTWRGVFLSQMGRNEEAIREIQRAESIDPLSLAVHMNAGWVYYVARRDALALQEWRKMLDLDPNFAVTHSSIWIAYLQQADAGKVLAHTAQSEDDTLRLAALTGSNAVSGNRTEAEHLLSRLALISKHHYVCPYEMATAHAVLGDKDEAMRWLQRGFGERSGCMVDLKTDPRLDSLRSDPKFNQLLRQVGFEP